MNSKIEDQKPASANIFMSIINVPRRWIRQLYAWMLKWSESPQAQVALSAFSFSESSFFPIPPDPLLIAMSTASPKRWIRFALICTTASVAGALFGYFIGVALFESVGEWVLNTYHLHEAFNSLEQSYKDNAVLAVFAAAFTPIPFKVITISAGAFHIGILPLVGASIIGRGGRFFLVSLLGAKLGAKYKDQIERYIDILSVLFLVLLVGGFYAIKHLG